MSPQEAYSVAWPTTITSKGIYDLAVESFKLYRQQFPESPLADNALYWIGECHYSQRMFEEAIDAFDELILTYPQGDKAAAATSRKASASSSSAGKAEALAALKLLVAKYPRRRGPHCPGQNQGAHRKMRDINSLNKVILVGRLGQKPEIRSHPQRAAAHPPVSPWPPTSGS